MCRPPSTELPSYPNLLIYLFSLKVSKLSLLHQHTHAPTPTGSDLAPPTQARTASFYPCSSVPLLSALDSIHLPQPFSSRKPTLAIKPNPPTHTHPRPRRQALPQNTPTSRSTAARTQHIHTQYCFLQSYQAQCSLLGTANVSSFFLFPPS